MFGDLPVFGRPAVSAPVDKNPTFPLFLLPTFNIPFHRRRPENDYFDPHAESPSENAVPSLSSSPDSLNGTEILASPISLRPFLTKFSVFGDGRRDRSARKRRLVPFLTGARVVRTQPDTIRCNTCATDLAFASQIVSRGFTGRHGRAFLIAPPPLQSSHPFPESPLLKNANLARNTTPADLINIKVGRPETRQLVTGLHSVADIWCIVCKTKIGWKYVDACEQEQKYKIGKFILETARVAVHQAWEDARPPSSRKENHDNAPQRTTGEKSNESSARSSSETNTDTTASRASVEGSSYLHDEDDDIVVFDSEDEDECDDIFAGVWDARTVAKRRKTKAASMR